MLFLCLYVFLRRRRCATFWQRPARAAESAPSRSFVSLTPSVLQRPPRPGRPPRVSPGLIPWIPCSLRPRALPSTKPTLLRPRSTTTLPRTGRQERRNAPWEATAGPFAPPTVPAAGAGAGPGAVIIRHEVAARAAAAVAVEKVVPALVGSIIADHAPAEGGCAE